MKQDDTFSTGLDKAVIPIASALIVKRGGTGFRADLAVNDDGSSISFELLDKGQGYAVGDRLEISRRSGSAFVNV